MSLTKRLDKQRWSLQVCAIFKNHFIMKTAKLTSQGKKTLDKTVWFQKKLWTNSRDVISINCLDCRRPDASAFYPSQEAVSYADPSSSSPLSISFIVYIITPIQSAILCLVQKNIFRDLGKILRFKIFFYILGALVVLMGPLILLFCTSGDVCPGFQSQTGFPHLCASLPVSERDTCRPLGNSSLT